MPIYEYCCNSCGHGLEALQKMSDEPLLECPACHKPALQKLVSAAGFRLKGSGWYETDFKCGGKTGKAAAAATTDSAPATPPPACGSAGCCPAADA